MPETMEEQLIRVIAEAIRTREFPGAMPIDLVAREAAQVTGLRRAAWATYTELGRRKLIAEAVKRAGATDGRSASN